MPLSSEIGRTLRHAITPLVVFAVSQEWLPEAAQNDVIEFFAIAGTFIGVYLASRRAQARKEAQKKEGEG